MEWDEVETAELFQKFESLASAKFTELRQKHWRECTTAITDVRKMISELRADFEEGIGRVNSEKAELEKELEKCREMIEGKNLELLGLRRQLRSYNLSKHMCKKCECEVPEVESKVDKEQAEQAGRKRARFNLSLSSSDSPEDTPDAPVGTNSGPTRRPSEKRLCLSTSNGQMAVEINKQKNSNNSSGFGDAPNVFVPETQQDSPSNGSPGSRTLTDGIATGENSDSGIKPEEGTDQSVQTPLSDPLSRRPFGLSALSPPSTIYDASAAIRRAVNHLDLANYEPSVIATPSQMSKQSKNRSGGHRAGGHVPRHLHKKTCRHYQSPKSNRPAAGRRSRPPVLANDLLSDATGADLTFPSISTFVEAADSKRPTAAASIDPETALMPPPPPPPDINVRVTRRTSRQGAIDNLPSLGGSPTAQKNIATQLPGDTQAVPSKRNSNANRAGSSPNNNNGLALKQCDDCEEYLRAVGLSPKMIEQHLQTTVHHTHLSPRGRKRPLLTVGNSTLSTPQDFWSLGALSPLTPSSSQNARRNSSRSSRRPDVGAAFRKLRRRRPLEMPKRS